MTDYSYDLYWANGTLVNTLFNKPGPEALPCPVCGGSGRVFDEILGSGNAGATKTCHGCDGKGWITV